jgi:undecaprenyl-diphosphatase
LPVVTRLAGGRLPALTLLHDDAAALDQSRLVLRLWPTDIGLADTTQTPIWVGSIVVERLSRHLSLFTSVATGPDVNVGRDALASELPDGKLITRSDGAESSNWDGRALLLRAL